MVVGESIAAERERGKSALAAAVSGARSVVRPITVGVLTTILAFLPLLFVTAGSYQIVNVFPWVALFVLLISLVEAFFILPAHLVHERRWSAPPLSDVQDWVRAWLDEIRDRIVVPAVSWSVRNTWLTLAVAVAVVLVSLVLIRSEAVRVVVFDRDLDAPDSIQADLHLPAGTPFEVTVAAAERFAGAARAVNDELDGTPISAVSLLAGNLALPRPGVESDNASHLASLASVRIHLNPRPVRTASPVEIESAWRRHAGDVSGLGEVEYRTSRLNFPPNVAYAIKHEDPEILAQAAAELRSLMETVPAGRRLGGEAGRRRNLRPGPGAGSGPLGPRRGPSRRPPSGVLSPGLSGCG